MSFPSALAVKMPGAVGAMRIVSRLMTLALVVTVTVATPAAKPVGKR